MCRRVRSTSAVPVIILTARADEIDRVLGFELGADDYMTKPFSPRELAARVKAVIRRAWGHPHPSAVLAAGDVQVDTRRREAGSPAGWYPGHREFALSSTWSEIAAWSCRASSSSMGYGASAGTAMRAPSMFTSASSGRSSATQACR